MASLPHAPSPNSNNTQSSPLLPSPLPMNHSLHNLLQYDQQLCHAHLEKPSYPSHIIGSLGFTPHSNEKLYAGLSRNPQDQLLIAAGGEVSLLTSSWEALDKLVSANSMSTGSMNEVSDNLNCLIMGIKDGIMGSSPTYSEVEQKPLNLYNASNSSNGGRNMWVPATSTSHAASACSIEKKNVGLDLAKFSADPGFAERAANFSSYSQQMNQAYSINNVSLDGTLATRKLDSVAPHKSPASKSPIKTSTVVAAADNAVAEEPSLSEGIPIIKPCIPSKNNEDPPQRANHGKKKRAGSKDVHMDDQGNGKRPKTGESVLISEIKAKSVMKPQQSTSGNSGDSEQKPGKETSKPSDAPKPDFIHVRARRGQATDSHSLAERVRREKISERMKYLQDLVPGCSKVTGKAVMLDEIINYVQSLQKQVEFLSMKLAAVHPSKLEFNLENLFGKEVVQPISRNHNSVACAPESNINSYNPSFNLHDNQQINSSLHCISQITQAWDDDLQNVVQMGFAQSCLQGPLFYGQMKTEL